MDTKWHILSISEVEQKLGTNVHSGLTREEAKKRFDTYGPNELPAGEPDSYFTIFLRQFKSPLIYILLAASAIVYLMGDVADSIIIAFILVFNAAVGAIQEGKAQGALLALKKFAQTRATVLRGGEEMIILDREVVPGDVLILQEGEKIPADARVAESRILRVDEAALTGESVPVHKEDASISNPALQPADQINMVFKGTNAVSGTGRAIVVATGKETLIGKISQAVAAIDTEIPLKRDIDSLARVIIISVAVISSIVFFEGIYFGKVVRDIFATVVALAVSIVPQGLPLVLTLVLATGVWRMAKRNALVKKLQAVEALGQAKVIAVDKTGTLTKNELVIREVYIDGKIFSIGGTGYEPSGEVKVGGEIIDPANHQELLLAGKIAAFCANAHAIFSDEEKVWRVAGDPTEAAMAVFAEKIGFHKSDLEKENPLTEELPFDYKTKYHVTVHSVGGKQFLSLVGAPEIVVGICERILKEGEPAHISSEEKKRLFAVIERMAGRGLRTVAFSYLEIPKGRRAGLEEKNFTGLVFGGFFGMVDALRPEVPGAMAAAREAGIRVVMITGDHRLTAFAIAKEAEIWKEGDGVMTSEDIERLGEDEMARELNNITVFARITPEHKMKIVNAYRKRGEIVAMTGDGVNDAPSLVAADLGVAMGKIGTEVAKEASDIVLLDDNFGSIVSAIEEGRNMFKTIQKNVLFLVSTSIGEVLVIAGAMFIGFPIPLLPSQIIWLNLVTDALLGITLAFEPREKDLLKTEFKRPRRGVIDALMVKRFFVMSIPMMLGTFYIFGQHYEFDIVKAQTIALTVLAVFQWFNAWNCRSESKSIFGRGMFSNKFLVFATLGIVPLQMLAVYWTPLQALLGTTALTLGEWGWILLVAFSIIIAEEARKAHASVKKDEAEIS